MNKLTQLMTLIQDLSRSDTKTLDRKFLKVSEEVGELAGALQPFSGCAGTHHRFVEQSDVVEEVADSMLALYSIVHSMGISDDDLISMLYRKALKWQSIQLREDMIKDLSKIPFEIHVSIGPKSSELDYTMSPLFRRMFEEACKNIGVKATILELYNKDGSTSQDWMTSSVHVGTNESVDNEMRRIVNALEDWLEDIHEFDVCVVRKKIETVPWHPAAQVERIEKLEHGQRLLPPPPGCYFEHHWEIAMDEETAKIFRENNHIEGCVLSRNLRKGPIQSDPTKLVYSLTYRYPFGSRNEFETKVKFLGFRLRGLDHIDSISEYSIFDSNEARDENWIGQSKT